MAKFRYSRPKIEVQIISLEQSFAAGSAIVYPQNTDQVVQDEWDVEPDDNRTVNW